MKRRNLLILAIVLGIVALTSPLWFRALPRSWTGASAPRTSAGVPADTPAPESASAPPNELRLTVHDSESQVPIEGASVQVGQQRGTTDALGVCVLQVARGSTYPIEVEFAGFVPWQGEVNASVPARQALAVEVALQPNTVQGHVVGQGGEPLPRATVTFGGQPVVLDAKARFVLRRAKQGDLISAEHPGYLPAQATYEGQPTISLMLAPSCASIEVRDAMTEQAIPNASVCAGKDLCQSTDNQGKAGLCRIADGTTLTANHQGYRLGETAYQSANPVQIELAPGELHGMVRDAESGQPLTHTIMLVNGQMVPLDEDGRYHLPDLTEVYTLYVKSPGHERLTIPIRPETQTSQYQSLRPCQDPAQMPCIDISLPRFAAHGIYVRFDLLWARKRMMSMIDLVDRSPTLNAIVLDIKGDMGDLAFESTDPIIASGKATSTPRMPLSEFLRICKAKRIYTIARMVIFKDDKLIKARPELAVRHPNGTIFYDREGLAWADPTLEEVWEYNIAITKEAIRLGFDEVQYDYLRFPSDSSSLTVVRALVYSVPSTLESRTGAIAGFVKAAKAAVDPTPAFLSADLFGYALSVEPEQDMRIGQRLKDLAPLVDYVCPMVYPSTFIPGNLGLQSPTDHPYEVVAISLDYARERTDTLMRPWLQHYWYTRREFAEQRRAAEEKTSAGWCYWNAGGVYDELFFAPPEGIRP